MKFNNKKRIVYCLTKFNCLISFIFYIYSQNFNWRFYYVSSILDYDIFDLRKTSLYKSYLCQIKDFKTGTPKGRGSFLTAGICIRVLAPRCQDNRKLKYRCQMLVYEFDRNRRSEKEIERIEKVVIDNERGMYKK